MTENTEHLDPSIESQKKINTPSLKECWGQTSLFFVDATPNPDFVHMFPESESESEWGEGERENSGQSLAGWLLVSWNLILSAGGEGREIIFMLKIPTTRETS